MSRILSVALLFLATAVHTQDWPQWGRDAQHDSATANPASSLSAIHASFVVDPFVDTEKALSGEDLLAHYPVPLVDGDDLYLIEKTGTFTSLSTRETQTWNVKNIR